MLKNTPADPAKIIPAATLVISRKAQAGGPPELLMVTRSKAMAFAGGAAVFPGGRVDDADRDLAARIAPDAEQGDFAARIAAIRETLEETGLAIGLLGNITAQSAAQARKMLLEHGTLASVLDHFGWEPAPDALTPFARWLPRLNEIRTFDTRFYLADLGTGDVEIAVDATENTKLFWNSAADVLAKAASKDLTVIYPTLRNLERLAQFDNFTDLREHAVAFAPEIISPWIDETGSEPVLRIPDDRGYPVTFQALKEVTRG